MDKDLSKDFSLGEREPADALSTCSNNPYFDWKIKLDALRVEVMGLVALYGEELEGGLGFVLGSDKLGFIDTYLQEAKAFLSTWAGEQDLLRLKAFDSVYPNYANLLDRSLIWLEECFLSKCTRLSKDLKTACSQPYLTWIRASFKAQAWPSGALRLGILAVLHWRKVKLKPYLQTPTKDLLGILWDLVGQSKAGLEQSLRHFSQETTCLEIKHLHLKAYLNSLMPHYLNKQRILLGLNQGDASLWLELVSFHQQGFLLNHQQGTWFCLTKTQEAEGYDAKDLLLDATWLREHTDKLRQRFQYNPVALRWLAENLDKQQPSPPPPQIGLKNFYSHEEVLNQNLGQISLILPP